MIKNFSEEDVHKTLTAIMHPVIECNIVDLGLIKYVVLEGRQATITIAFPFIGVPVKELPIRGEIIRSVTETIKNLGLNVKIKIIEMNAEEFENFLAKERETWKSIK